MCNKFRKRMRISGAGIILMAGAAIAAVPWLLPTPPRSASVSTQTVSETPKKAVASPPPIYLGSDRPLLSEPPSLHAETQSLETTPQALSPIGPLLENVSQNSGEGGVGGGGGAGFGSSAYVQLPAFAVSFNSDGGLPSIERQFPEQSRSYGGGGSGGGGSGNSGRSGAAEPTLWTTFPAGKGIQVRNNTGVNPNQIYPPFSLPRPPTPGDPASVPEPASLAAFPLALFFLRRRKK